MTRASHCLGGRYRVGLARWLSVGFHGAITLFRTPIQLNSFRNKVLLSAEGYRVSRIPSGERSPTAACNRSPAHAARLSLVRNTSNENSRRVHLIVCTSFPEWSEMCCFRRDSVVFPWLC
ncbi:hypothetical protein NDU88_006351 [Pleurodeles waltl]|uniref:Uncharacterized protein n=1 Tax=Pleurodeles waltl TaxID=8319 RepID=A0AAV7QLH9_PLEWA|nr:hypothetical protein NDU88_006351 [Pleurodeles waltl]